MLTAIQAARQAELSCALAKTAAVELLKTIEDWRGGHGEFDTTNMI
jgi:hypothetical protein